MSNEENYQTISLEERRKAILDALDDGKEISSADMEFLLDQLLNTSNINLGARGLENLNKILTGNMQESFNSVSNEFLNSAIKTTKQASLGAEKMGNSDISRDVSIDFGFKDLQADLEKAKTKDDFYELIKNAQKRAIETRYNGTGPDNALANDVREARQGLKWHQFRRKRMAKKAEKDLDPSAYWSTKAADGNAVTSWYYGLRSRMAERKTNKGKSLSEKLQNNISNRKEYSELKWFSSDFGKKLGLRAEIAFSRSPEKLMKKIMKKGNLEDVKNITDKEWLNGGSLKDAAKKLSDKKAAGYSMTKAELKTLEMYDAVLKDCKTAETYMNNLKNNKLGNVKLLKDPKTEALENKFKKKMQEKADQINKNAMETFKKSPTYKAYKKLNGGKEPKLENIVSGKDVFKKMLEENGYSQDDIAQFMDQYYPEQDTVFREDEKDKKQEQQPEKENDSGKEATFGNSGYDPTKHIPILDDGKGNVQVFKSKDSKSYDACFKDEKGNNRFPTEEEYMKIAEAMKKDGWTKVKFNLDNLKPEQLKANLEVFEKAGLEITNKEDVMKAIAGYEKENPHAYGQEIGEEERESSNPPNQDNTGENKTVDKGIEKVLNNIVAETDQDKRGAQMEVLNNILNAENLGNGTTHAELLEKLGKAGFGNDDKKFLITLLSDKAIAQEASERTDLDGTFTNEELQEITKGNTSKDISHDAVKTVENISKINEWAKLPEAEWEKQSKNLSPQMSAAVNAFRIIDSRDASDSDKNGAKRQIVQRLISDKFKENKSANKGKEFTKDIAKIVNNVKLNQH